MVDAMSSERAARLERIGAIARTLRAGTLVADRTFDEVYPLGLRRASSVHWTPVEVGVRAANLLAARPGDALLDIGAGIGKFCIVAAAVAPGARVRGVEHRERFVEIAREAARAVGVDVEMVHGTLDAVDPSTVDGVYMFNPFAENLSPVDDHLDETVELSEPRYRRDVAAAERFLAAARVGTRVVTYCGWGGRMPATYTLALRERCAGTLELWRKTAD